MKEMEQFMIFILFIGSFGITLAGFILVIKNPFTVDLVFPIACGIIGMTACFYKIKEEHY